MVFRPLESSPVSSFTALTAPTHSHSPAITATGKSRIKAAPAALSPALIAPSAPVAENAVVLKVARDTFAIRILLCIATNPAPATSKTSPNSLSPLTSELIASLFSAINLFSPAMLFFSASNTGLLASDISPDMLDFSLFSSIS